MNGEIETITSPLPVGVDIEKIAEQAEKKIAAVKKIKNICLLVTNKHDWIDQGGKPYLQSSGAEKIARLFGISWRIDEPVCEYEDDGHFSYTYKGYFSLGGATIEAIGSRSTKDPFFQRKGKDGEILPPSVIDRGDVKKAAYTNLLMNGITRILGIRNLTWDDLAEAGIVKDTVSRVEYRKGGKVETDILFEDSKKVVTGIVDIRKKTGQTDGKSWTIYTIRGEGAVEYKTFSETTAKLAKEAMEAGLQVEIVYKEGKYGFEVESLRKIEPENEE